MLCPKRVLSIYKVSRGQSEAALSTVRSNNSCYLRCLSAIWGSSGAISAAETPMGPHGGLWGPHGAPWGAVRAQLLVP